MPKKSSLLEKVNALTTTGKKQKPKSQEVIKIQNILVLAENWHVSPLEVLNKWTIPMRDEAINLLMERQQEKEEKEAQEERDKNFSDKTKGLGVKHG